MADRPRSPSVIVVLVTCPGQAVGVRIGRAVVEDRLAACVNVLPGLTSIFSWEGKVRRSGEALLVIKTRRSKFAALSRRVRELHPYSVPEIIALPVVAGSGPYLSWIRNSTP